MTTQQTPTKYNLDPDFRPAFPDTSKPYCCRCQKAIAVEKTLAKSAKVSVNWDTHEVWRDEAGEFLLGPDCIKAIGMEAR